LRTSVVVTFIGEDKPGLIEAISEVVARHEGNWLESRMSQLAGKFAGIIQVGVDDEQVADLTTALKGLESEDFSVLIEESESETAGRATKILQLNILGLDRPGIVHEVSQALAREAINVAEMSTNITTAAMTGELLFDAEASIEVPESVDLYHLEEQLETIGNELAVDIDLILNQE
jgi:glycine cleavage system regulatory protein